MENFKMITFVSPEIFPSFPPSSRGLVANGPQRKTASSQEAKAENSLAKELNVSADASEICLFSDANKSTLFIVIFLKGEEKAKPLEKNEAKVRHC